MGLGEERTHVPRAFDRFRDLYMVLPTQAVLSAIANHTKLSDVLVQKLIHGEKSAHVPIAQSKL